MKSIKQLPTLGECLAKTQTEKLLVDLGDRVCLLSDCKGNVVHVWNSYMSTHFDFVNIIIGEKAGLFNLFQISPAGDLNSAVNPEELCTFPAQTSLSSKFFLEKDFYTDLHYCFIRLEKIFADLFFGVVYFSRFLPNIHYPSNNFLMFILPDETIRGYSKPLEEIVQRNPPIPGKMLGKKVSEIFNPSPADYQKKHLVEDMKFLTLPWDRVFTWDGVKPVECIPSGDVNNSPKGICWKNTDTIPAFWKIPVSLNTFQHHFRVAVTYEQKKGTGPLVILSRHYSNEAEKFGSLDYQFGTDLLTGRFHLKKQNYALVHSTEILQPGATIYDFSIAGSSLFSRVNNRPVLSYWDPSIIRQDEVFMYLLIRPETEIILSRIEISIQNKPALHETENKEEMILGLKDDSSRSFLVSRFHNQSLSSRDDGLTGYILTDVSSLRASLTGLEGRYRTLQAEERRLKELLGLLPEKKLRPVGLSESFRKLMEKSEVIAKTQATILLTGPTGSGKEVLARYIHAESPRKDKPFVKVDCSALPETLLDSELFGHEKGAFTGAAGRQIGRFEQAHGGTIFLDEIGNMSLSIQKKLLGVLQDQEITRLGGDKVIKLDIRILAATNVNLSKLISRGEFREDLYYRINSVMLELPPLREHPEDILALCNHFISEFNESLGKSIQTLSSEACQKLYHHSWPGNIRELKNVIQKAMIFTPGSKIDADFIEFSAQETSVREESEYTYRRHTVKHLSKKDWEELLRKHRGKISAISEEVGITRKACYENLQKNKLIVEKYR